MVSSKLVGFMVATPRSGLVRETLYAFFWEKKNIFMGE